MQPGNPRTSPEDTTKTTTQKHAHAAPPEPTRQPTHPPKYPVRAARTLLLSRGSQTIVAVSLDRHTRDFAGLLPRARKSAHRPTCLSAHPPEHPIVATRTLLLGRGAQIVFAPSIGFPTCDFAGLLPRATQGVTLAPVADVPSSCNRGWRRRGRRRCRFRSWWCRCRFRPWRCWGRFRPRRRCRFRPWWCRGRLRPWRRFRRGRRRSWRSLA